jgi:hypothetical protein
MNKIIALFVLLVLTYFCFFKYEFFQSTSQASSTTSVAPSTASLSFFELSDGDKKIINNVENEQEILNVEREEQRMKNNVKKIVKEAKNVLAYTDLNMDYFKEIKFNNETTQQVNSDPE